jgi:sporulation protein YlmC with PRC-barrel domain
MRLTHLLGSEVIDVDGVPVGPVHDVRLAEESPASRDSGPRLRVTALLLGPTAIGARLGFERGRLRGPWPLDALFRAVHRRMRVAAWDEIAAIEHGRIRLRVPKRDLEDEVWTGDGSPRLVDAGLELLDRQLVDPDGRMAGNVDDLELRFPGQGPPAVSAILAGPGALADRIGGRLGSTVARIHERLRDCHIEGPARIDIGLVRSIGSDIELSVANEELETHRFERWVRDAIVAKIPGS